jgi:hypothetical protein
MSMCRYVLQGTSIGALVRALTEISLLLDAAEIIDRAEFL